MSELRKRFGSTSSSATSPVSPSFLNNLKEYDAYAKPLEDFRVRTATGAAITLSSAIIIIFLVFSEFIDWYHTDVLPSLEVDKGRKEKMLINVNITFPRMPCYLLAVDVMDVAGEHQNNVEHSMHKARLDENGNMIEKSRSVIGKDAHTGIETARNDSLPANYCGNCFGATPPSSGCCNTCNEVQEAYQKMGWSFAIGDVEQCIREGWAKLIDEQSHEGCNVHGSIEINKVQGNFHFAPGRSFEQQGSHVHDLHEFNNLTHKFDFTHTIHHLSFGKMVENLPNPLDGVQKKASQKFEFYQYFVKVVSSEYTYLNGSKIATNQFSVTEHERDVTPILGIPIGMPGVFFNMEISPMLIKYKEYRKPFSHFLTDLCTIVGGVFTVAGIIDSLLYTTEKTFKAKAEIGKAT